MPTVPWTPYPWYPTPHYYLERELPTKKCYTSEGKETGQSFYSVNMDVEDTPTIIQLTLKGTYSPIKFTQYCENCGAKRAKHSAKYCYACGQKL